MNDHRVAISAPAWFTVAAVGAVLFEAVQTLVYVGHVTTDPATQPTDARSLSLIMPDWMTMAFAVSAWVGLLGAFLLLFRRRLAEPLLLVSLLAGIVQWSALLIDPRLRNMVASDALLMPFIIIVVCYGVWQLARVAKKSGWLR